MNENGTNTSSEIPPRTIEVIRSERGDNYPQKHRDTIRHPRDREDFLVAAYAMIIASRLGKSTLERLLTAG